MPRLRECPDIIAPMLIKRLLQSLTRAGEGGTRTAPNALKREAEHLTGFNWLVRGRHGIYLASDNDVYIGRALIHYGEYSELEWRVLERYCRSGDTAVEVGANIGAHTVSLAKAVGPSGRVVAIEPQPIIFQMLCANVALNCLLHVETLNCACGSGEGMMGALRLDYEAQGNFGGFSLQGPNESAPSTPVIVKRLDDLLRGSGRLDLIKIDVEGMEADVLTGAAGVIERFRPTVYVENERLDKSRALIEAFWDMDYRLWWHAPPLFNPDNYYANERNLYPRIGTFNMLCLHRSKAAEPPQELDEVTDAGWHPHPLARTKSSSRRDER